jgi:MFS superfamily sulfate permease-like transporter
MEKLSLNGFHVAAAWVVFLATLAVMAMYVAWPDEVARRRAPGFLLGVILVNAFATLYFVRRSRRQRAHLGIMVTKEGASGPLALFNDLVALLVPAILLLALVS